MTGRRFGHPVDMTHAHRRSVGLAGVAALIGFLATSAAPGAAAAPDFPANDARYHNYPEMVAEIHEVEAARPDIVDVFSIGKSARGRDIWAAKVSDNVATDEDEPEVLFDAVHHGDEHLTLEQALYLFNTLVDNYGVGPKVTRLVDSREVWIVFMLNPDGAQFDLGGDPYRDWRKNRQLHPTSRHVGTDLNRNYNYRWGCCGGSSGNPASETYRGWEPFSAPETRAFADFVNSRVVDGRQQIRTHATLHANGELILWPWGYTRRNLAGEMTTADRDAFVAMARGMAATNGYRVMQSADWYITDGDQIDWMYGRHGIFSFTLELYPGVGSGPGSHYPPDEKIAMQTKRNHAALLYLIDLADCPYRASGTEAEHCGLESG
jgi:carboxypeptidase T